MTRRLLLTLVAVSVTAAAFARDDDEDAQIAKELSKIARQGRGPHEIQKDKKGRIVSGMFVGQARISTALGKSKGLDTAQEKAALDAKAVFVRWLKEDVKVYTSSDEEEVILLAGKEGDGDEGPVEGAVAVERTSKKMESMAAGMVRGLELLHKEVDAENKTLFLLYGWDAEAAAGVDAIRKGQEGGKAPAGGGKDGKPAGEGKPANKDKALKDEKSSNTRAAKKYLRP
ncbi:MAG: hypothetical protein K2X87_03540 [Gemmataceae bacterium]|nr:hypothetical protein [Gemmataceae bacterium]